MDRIAGFLSRSSQSNLFKAVIIFFSTTQLGYHFWPDSSLVYGVRVDYLSPTLYFFDLLLIFYITTNKFENWRIWDLRFAAPVFLINLLYSQNPLATLAWSAHVVIYISAILSLQIKKHVFVKAVSITLIFQACLSLAQISLSHSVGGLLYYLGERSVAVGAPNIAMGEFMNNLVLRAYGTFGHPNVLAGWAVVGFLIIARLVNKIYAPLVVVSLIVVLTQSRSAAISLFGIVIPFLVIKKPIIRIAYFVVACLISLSLNFFSPTRAGISIGERLNLQSLSISSIKHFPVFGSGAQASITTYPNIDSRTRLLQPDHNSFTLLFSWFGIAGLLAILYLLSRLRGHTAIRPNLLFPILPLLFLDHYFLTSPQGIFILLLYTSMLVKADAQTD